MDLFERIIFFSIGSAVGFVLGYVVARLRIIEVKLDFVKAEVHEVDELVKHKRVGGEDGFMRIPLVADIAYLVALVLILAGLWFMHKERQIDTQDRENIGRLSICNSEYLHAQAQFLSVYLEDPPATRPEQRRALENYVELLEAYNMDDGDLLVSSPYSNRDALQDCVESDIVKEIESNE